MDRRIERFEDRHVVDPQSSRRVQKDTGRLLRILKKGTRVKMHLERFAAAVQTHPCTSLCPRLDTTLDNVQFGWDAGKQIKLAPDRPSAGSQYIFFAEARLYEEGVRDGSGTMALCSSPNTSCLWYT